MRDDREKRDLHALDGDGMVLCNPRDREAAHRAEVEGIATDNRAEVTCRKCIALMYKVQQAGKEVRYRRRIALAPARSDQWHEATLRARGRCGSSPTCFQGGGELS